jgi:hypothetical protein
LKQKIIKIIISILLVSLIASSCASSNLSTTISPINKSINTLEEPTEPTKPTLTHPFYTEGLTNLHNWEIIHYTKENKDIYEKETNTVLGNDTLEFNINIPETYIYYFNNQYNYDDVRIDVTLINNGADSNYQSVICRYDPYEGWYEFVVSSAGDAAILHYSNEKDFIIIGSGGIENINGKTSDTHTNKITAICKGDALTLLVNDVEWRTFQDNSISRGRVGVSVGTKDAYPVNVVVDKFEVSSLPETTYTIANTKIKGLTVPIDCTDWWDCASKTKIPDDPRFSGWTRMGGISGNKDDPWALKIGWTNENEWREERTKIIWDYLCQIKGCPSEKDISTYLLYQEGSVLLDDEFGLEIMIKAFKFKFSTDSFIGLEDKVYTGDGITITDLSFFTPFFNPEDDGASFTEADWKMLTTKPAPIYIRQVEKWWDDEPYPICGINGEVVDHWWTRGEKPATAGWILFYQAYDSSGHETIGFGS